MRRRLSPLALLAALAGLLLLAAPALAGVPATLTLTAEPPAVVWGGSTSLAGTVSVAGAELVLLAQPAGATDFTEVTRVYASGDGSYAFVAVSPVVNTTYRVTFAGDAVNDAAAADLPVRVRPRITTAFPKTKSLWAGKPATLRGAVAPAHPGSQVTLERKIDGVWQTYAVCPLDADSRFSTTWTPEKPGFHYFRVTMAADAEHAVMITTSRRLVVNNPNPHNIPITYAHYIVIDHSEFHLYYYEHGRVIKKWDCVLGKPSTPTPLGHFRIYCKTPDPGAVMGPYFLGYYGAIGIHGTNQPYLIRRFPRAFSHGCTRLYNSQITWLYPRVPIGTPVWNIK